MRALLVDPAHAWVEETARPNAGERAIVYSSELTEWLSENARGQFYPFYEAVPGGGFQVCLMFAESVDEMLLKLSEFFVEE